MKSIAVDMDQVLADFMGKTSRVIKERFNIEVSKENVQFNELQKKHPKLMKDIFLMLNEPDFFRDFELEDEDAVPVMKELNKHYEIYIATAAMDVPGSFTAKYEWLCEYFPFLDTANFVFCGNKRIIKADFLIDDNVRQLQNFSGEGILYSQPYNEQYTQFKRVHNWKEIYDLFLPVK